VSERLKRIGIAWLATLIGGGLLVVLVGLIAAAAFNFDDTAIELTMQIGFPMIAIGVISGAGYGAVVGVRWVLQAKPREIKKPIPASVVPILLAPPTDAELLSQEPKHEPYEWMN